MSGVGRLAVMLLATGVMLSGCLGNPQSLIVGGSGQIRESEKEDVRAGVAVAERYVTAWVNRDYKRMFSVTCKQSSIYHDGNFAVAERWYSRWRDVGIKKKLHVTSALDAGEIRQSLRVIGNVTEMQCKLLLVLVVDNRRTLDALTADTWPNRVMFLRHRVGNKYYMLILVKETVSGKWQVMNDPGTLDEKGEPT